MKKVLLGLIILVCSAGMSLAVQMSYSDDGAGTITQTYSLGDFVAGSDDTYDFQFAQFDDQGGTRTLQSVTVEATQSAWGGYYEVDNDSASPAVISAYHGITGELDESSGYTYDLPSGADNTLDTRVTSADVSLSANDGDDTEVFNSGGTDYYRLDGPVQANAMSDSSSGTSTTSLDAYIGSGDLSMDYDVGQSSQHTGAGGVSYAGSPATADASFTVTYTYVVPEPTSMALLALACVALGLRRRNA